MADTKISGLTALTGANTASGDLLTIVDISDTTMAATGTNKSISLTQLQSAPVSAGTANGVLYLNGSKVATSGSALTFNGSTEVVLDGGSTKGRLTLVADNGPNAVLSTTTGFGAWSNFKIGALAHLWDISGSEQMRLTSTGLGIGTSSPAVKLHVDAGSLAPTSGHVARFDTSATTAYSASGYVGGQLRLNYGNATSSYGGINFSNFGATSQEFFGVVQNSSGYGAFVWQGYNGSAYAERMRLDSSGNLGLGVTPSAWYTSYGTKAFQFAGSGSVYGLDVSSSDRRAGLMNNAFINSSGNYIYINTGHATQYEQNAGKHVWNTAASGTAGNAITFTQAMTLDASGNLGIGTTSPSARLAVAGSTGTIATFTNGATADFSIICGSSITNLNAGGANIMAFQTGGTERARIDSSGNLIQSAPSTAPTLSTNGTMVFNLTSNTNLRVSVRGSDGVTRTANLTLA